MVTETVSHIEGLTVFSCPGVSLAAAHGKSALEAYELLPTLCAGAVQTGIFSQGRSTVSGTRTAPGRAAQQFQAIYLSLTAASNGTSPCVTPQNSHTQTSGPMEGCIEVEYSSTTYQAAGQAQAGLKNYHRIVNHGVVASTRRDVKVPFPTAGRIEFIVNNWSRGEVVYGTQSPPWQAISSTGEQATGIVSAQRRPAQAATQLTGARQGRRQFSVFGIMAR